MQEVGFAHGTIGVIAFLAGVSAGRGMQHRYGEENLKWPLALCLGLSPAVYLLMTQCEPQGVWTLSAYTFMAQILFGMGLNACRRYIENISGERYRKTVNPLYIPVISLCILMPMALSGFMLEKMTFEEFFLADAVDLKSGCVSACRGSQKSDQNIVVKIFRRESYAYNVSR